MDRVRAFFRRLFGRDDGWDGLEGVYYDGPQKPDGFDARGRWFFAGEDPMLIPEVREALAATANRRAEVIREGTGWPYPKTELERAAEALLPPPVTASVAERVSYAQACARRQDEIDRARADRGRVMDA